MNGDEVITLIKDGEWELGYGTGTRDDGRYWIQRGGLSKGGESRMVSSTVVQSLQRRGLVEVVPREPKQPFLATTL